MNSKKTTYLPDEFVYNQPEVEIQAGFSNIDEQIQKSNDNFKLLKELGKKSQEAGHEVLGGYFSMVVADGKVWHQVTAYNKTAKLYFVKRCAGICLDEYYDQYIGESEWLKAEFVEDKVKGQRAMEKLFSK